MRYSRVHLDAIGHALAPVVVSSVELEERLRPVYAALHIQPGQLELITGIAERRWWEPGTPLAHGAEAAARAALAATGVEPGQLETLIYGAVCREHFEPATACRIAHDLGVNRRAAVYDVSNACLGLLNGLVDIADRIELGRIRAGMVVACESARDIVELTIERLNRKPDMELFKRSLATLTGGSGAAAVVLTDGSFPSPRRHRLLGGVHRTAPEHFDLCRWGIDPSGPGQGTQFTSTDSVAVLENGVVLGLETWRDFLAEMGWTPAQVDKIICHQVGAGHQRALLQTLAIPAHKDFTSFEYLGNIGTVSLPLTAALAAERDFLQAGDRVGFLGIGSGLNCLMLGLEW